MYGYAHSAAMIETIANASRLYFDTNVLIYFVEGSEELSRPLRKLMEFARDAKLPMTMSEIGVAECLYGAYKLKSAALAAHYREIFDEIALFDLVPVDGERLRRAAQLGAEKGLKLIDVVHFLATVDTRCDVFVTGDSRIRSSRGVLVATIDALGLPPAPAPP